MTRTPILILLALLALPAQALDWGYMSMRDVGRDEDGLNWIGIDLDLNEGWKTYWQYAGQNGLDPVIELSQNGEPIEAEIHWPMPHLFIADDLPSVGYKGTVLIPISFQGDGKIDVTVDFGVCETVCVPIQQDFQVNAQKGYSIEQYILKGAATAPSAPACIRDESALANLDANQFWMFISESDGIIAHSASELEPAKLSEPMAIYQLAEDEITPLPCE